MFVLLVVSVWLGLSALTVCLCVAAARGDAQDVVMPPAKPQLGWIASIAEPHVTATSDARLRSHAAAIKH